jgi:hypothetical protein
MMSAEATARAAEMWRRGYSAGLIAEAVGSTRSAVVAKLRRLGVRRAVRDPTGSLRPPPAKPRKHKPQPVCEPIWVTFVELNAGMCRYPREVDGAPRFCGAATQSLSSSWCPAHKLICYTQREARPGATPVPRQASAQRSDAHPPRPAAVFV